MGDGYPRKPTGERGRPTGVLPVFPDRKVSFRRPSHTCHVFCVSSHKSQLYFLELRVNAIFQTVMVTCVVLLSKKLPFWSAVKSDFRKKHGVQLHRA